jgi:GNAT superfamily N-acetyltransferase
VQIRDARDDDDLDLLHQGWAPWFGEVMSRKMFAATPADVPKRMLVAEDAGELAGFALAVGAGIADGHRGLADVYVAPAHRRRGIGTALLDQVRATCTPDRVPGIRVQADADDATSRAVAEAHGFRLHGLHLESELDLSDLDRLRDLAAGPDDVTFAPLPEDTDDADWHAFHDQFLRLMQDAPDSASGSDPMPYEVFRAALPEPWQVHGAWVDGRMVGFTCVMQRDPVGRRVNTMLTGVDRDQRGRGLSTALKVSAAFALAERGWRAVVTQNMEGNAPILAANRRMGFRPAGGYVDLVWDYPR